MNKDSYRIKILTTHIQYIISFRIIGTNTITKLTFVNLFLDIILDYE